MGRSDSDRQESEKYYLETAKWKRKEINATIRDLKRFRTLKAHTLKLYGEFKGMVKRILRRINI
jgi:hypothetical protein